MKSGLNLSETTASQELFTWFLKEVGLDMPGARVMASVGTNMELNATVNFPIHGSVILNGERSVMDLYISELRERIRKSPEVTRMVSDVEKQNKELRDQIKSLKTQLSDLTPLKNHFDVEMKLRHGEPHMALDGLPVKSGLR